LPTGENLESLFKEISALSVVQAFFAILIAYGLLLAIQSLTNAVSERVPRRFRLLIKQSVPFLKALISLNSDSKFSPVGNTSWASSQILGNRIIFMPFQSRSCCFPIH
jgi:hypothetical protein